MDKTGKPIVANLPYNNPTDGPLDSSGNIIPTSGFLVDISTLPNFPDFPTVPKKL